MIRWDIHIVQDWNPLAPISVVVAECGATALIDQDGKPTPDGFDFYEPPNEDRATCVACRGEFRSRGRQRAQNTKENQK